MRADEIPDALILGLVAACNEAACGCTAALYGARHPATLDRLVEASGLPRRAVAAKARRMARRGVLQSADAWLVGPYEVGEEDGQLAIVQDA